MYRGNSSRIFPVIVVLVIIAIVVVVLVSIGRAIFGGGNDNTKTDQGRQALLSTSVSHSVRMTERGPIVADEDFHSYQITVSPDSRNLTTYTGYLDQVVANKSLGNNAKAYEEFVYALDKANLMKGTAFTGEKDDTRGICATGYLYDFEVIDSGSTVKHLWTSTCSGSKGSLKASTAQVKNLFLKQIPGNAELINKVNL